MKIHAALLGAAVSIASLSFAAGAQAQADSELAGRQTWAYCSSRFEAPDRKTVGVAEISQMAIPAGYRSSYGGTLVTWELEPERLDRYRTLAGLPQSTRGFAAVCKAVETKGEGEAEIANEMGTLAGWNGRFFNATVNGGVVAAKPPTPERGIVVRRIEDAPTKPVVSNPPAARPAKPRPAVAPKPRPKLPPCGGKTKRTCRARPA